MRRGWLAVVIVTVVLAFGALIAACSSSSSGEDTIVVDDVYDICNKFVEHRLAYPGSSTFQGIDDADVTLSGHDGTDVSYVDAANGFGAKSRRTFTCDVHYLGNGKWRLTNLDIDLT